jgi:hypothetical protein
MRVFECGFFLLKWTRVAFGGRRPQISPDCKLFNNIGMYIYKIMDACKLRGVGNLPFLDHRKPHQTGLVQFALTHLERL